MGKDQIEAVTQQEHMQTPGKGFKCFIIFLSEMTFARDIFDSLLGACDDPMLSSASSRCFQGCRNHSLGLKNSETRLLGTSPLFRQLRLFLGDGEKEA